MVSVPAESVGDAVLWLRENRGLGSRVLPDNHNHRWLCIEHTPPIPERPVLLSNVAMLVYDAGQPRFAWGKVAAPYNDNRCVLLYGAEIDTFDPERRWVVNWRGPTRGPHSITTSEAWLHGDAGVAIATLLNEERSAARRVYTQERSADKLRKVRKGGGGSGEGSVGGDGGSGDTLDALHVSGETIEALVTVAHVVEVGHADGRGAGCALSLEHTCEPPPSSHACDVRCAARLHARVECDKRVVWVRVYSHVRRKVCRGCSHSLV